MSAFMVEDTTINYVVNWLRREIDRFSFTRIPHELKGLGFDTSVAGWAENLGQAMFQLNRNAVDARYGNGESVKFRQLAYRFEHTEAVSLVQVLKSLQCWLYQCNEGDVPETELYELFADDVQLYLMDKIISALPEYEEAKWGVSALLPVRVAKPWPPERGMQYKLQTHEEKYRMKKLKSKGGERI